jgi:cytoskeletal protein CcmA (bactofilin family)
MDSDIILDQNVVTIQGDTTTVNGTADLKGNLHVEGTAELDGPVDLKSNLHVEGGAQIDKYSSFGGSVDIKDGASVGQILSVNHLMPTGMGQSLVIEGTTAGQVTGGPLTLTRLTMGATVSLEGDTTVNGHLSVDQVQPSKANSLTLQGNTTIQAGTLTLIPPPAPPAETKPGVQSIPSQIQALESTFLVIAADSLKLMKTDVQTLQPTVVLDAFAAIRDMQQNIENMQQQIAQLQQEVAKKP